MNGILRAALASLLLAAQCALSFHHHDVSLALRSSRNFHSTCVISADDDCALCSFQVQARSVAPVAVAVAAPSITIAVLSDAPSRPPRAARAAVLRARAPPVA